MEELLDTRAEIFRDGTLDVYMMFPQPWSMTQRTTAPNTSSLNHDGDVLYGRPLPVNDSLEAIDRDLRSIETRMDNLIAEVTKALSR